MSDQSTSTMNTDRIIEIPNSPGKLLMIGVLGLAMTALSLFIALGLLDNDTASFMAFIGWLGALFFGFCTIVAFRRVFATGTVITISPDGLRDTRLASGIIPWPEVRNIGTWAHSGQKVMVVQVDPEFEDKVGLSRIARMSRGANAKLGADGLAVTAQGTKIDHDTLVDLTVAYAEAWQTSSGHTHSN